MSSISTGDQGVEAGRAASGSDFPADLPDLLLRPLGGDHEMRHVFRGDVVERLEGVAQSGGVGRRGWLTAEGAGEWLRGLVVDETDGRPVRRWRRVLLALGSAAVLMILLGVGVGIWEMIPVVADLRKAPQWLKDQADRQVYADPGDRLTQRMWEDHSPGGAKQLWQQQPEDRALYAQYISSLAIYGMNLPEDYEATWRRLDPDNGLWHLAAAEAGLSHGGDPAAALALVEEAARQPRLETFQTELLARRMERFRQPETAVQFMLIADRQLASRAYGWYGSRWNYLNRLLTTGSPPPATAGALKIAAWIDGERTPETLRKVRNEGVMQGMLTLWWRGSLLAGAMLFAGMAALLFLRLVPRKGAPGRLAGCVSQVLRPWRAVPVTAVALLAAAGLGAWSLTLAEDEREESVMTLTVTGMGVVAALTVAAVVARREVRRRVGFLGMTSPGPWQGMLGGLLLAVTVVAVAVPPGLMLWGKAHRWVWPPAWRGRDEWLAAVMLGLGGVSAMVLVWMGLSALVGYASPRANVRHRLVALQMLPALLAGAVLMAGLAVFSQPVEKEVVRRAWERCFPGR